jgi:TonB family protein
MKTKKISSKNVSLRLLLVIPTIILALFVFALSASGQTNTATKKEVAPPPPPPPPPPVPSDKKQVTGMTDGAYQKVDVMPVYPGGNEALLKYIIDSTHYPKDAKIQNIQGKVLVRFVVNANGSVQDVSVLKGVSPSLDAESVRIVKTLPKFKPAELEGKTVPVWYVIPIQFSLQ